MRLRAWVSRESRLIGPLVTWGVPWLLCLLILAWAWRVDLFHQLPAYGDALEVTWAIRWYSEHLFDGHLLYYPLILHPLGWQVATFADGPLEFIPLVPLYWIGGAAFAYNVSVLISFFVAFGGMYVLSRRIIRSTWPAAVAALLFTFWSFRWIRLSGHLQILFPSALLPWMVWALDRAADSDRRWRWYALVGIMWGAMIATSLYFVEFGSLVLVGWVVGHLLSKRINRRTALEGTLISTCTAMLVAAPAILLFLSASVAATASFYNAQHLDWWGASLNSIFIPPVAHPWLGEFARWLYRGPLSETAWATLGLFACFFALVGLYGIRQDKNRWSAVILAVTGILLAFGLTVKWNAETIQLNVMRPLDSLLWNAAHRLKPGLFPSSSPPPPFDRAIPLPGLALVALAPFAEGARVLSRFIMVAGVGFFLLVAHGVARLRHSWLRLAAAGLLIFEVIPSPSSQVPFPPPAHPAFEWLREHTSPEDGIVDLYSIFPDRLSLGLGGEVLYATQYHQRSTAALASSIWPAHGIFLLNWLTDHPHPFSDPEFAPLLRSYQVNYILLHVKSEKEKQLMKDAGPKSEVQLVQCFDPVGGISPWPYPICVYKVLPPSPPGVDVFFREGWSAAESWGVWAEGTQSRAQWVATSRTDHHLQMEVFPQCVSGKNQGLVVEASGVELARYVWRDCQPRSANLLIPASLVQIGWNDIQFHYGYAAEPAVLTGGANADMRKLSIGFTKLLVSEH